MFTFDSMKMIMDLLSTGVKDIVCKPSAIKCLKYFVVDIDSFAMLFVC